MTITKDHPRYAIKIDPSDKTVLGTEFGDVPFTQQEFEFGYSDDVKEQDIPMSFVKVFGVKEEIVMNAWNHKKGENYV